MERARQQSQVNQQHTQVQISQQIQVQQQQQQELQQINVSYANIQMNTPIIIEVGIRLSIFRWRKIICIFVFRAYRQIS